MSNDNKAAPADEREAMDLAFKASGMVKFKDTFEAGFQAGAAHARAQGAPAAPQGQQEAVAVLYKDGTVLTKEQCQNDKAFAVCCKVETPLYTTPQPAPAVAALVEALENMLAAFDNPILRRKLSSEFNAQAIEEARAALSAFRGEGGE